MSNRKRSRILTAFTFLALAGWMGLFGVYLAWTFWPVHLPTVKQPIQILNPNKAVTVGDPIMMRLEVNKPQPVNVRSADRLVRCQSGNLIPLTSTAIDLPVGDFVVEASSVILPDKVLNGDTCTFLYRIGYYINPVRSETVEYESEPFVTLLPKEGLDG